MDDMEGLSCFLFFLAVVAVLSGPVALIMAWTALRRVEDMRRRWNEVVLRSATRSPEPPPSPAAPVPEPPVLAPPEEQKVVVSVETSAAQTSEGPSLVREHHEKALAAAAAGETSSLEQRIGTRWVLVAGVITVIFAVGFFLKHAVENQWIGPWGRVGIAGLGGLAALIIGEITRRRGFDFAAKGVTALGFAILYATVFAAHRWYSLIGPAPAYVLAIAVTAAAMSYAVVLDEVAIALLSLAGGYVTPIMLSTGENLPNALFAYVLILSIGAMLCAYWREWSPVNVLAFLGTYLLYTAWFDKFYRPLMDLRWPPPQLGVAMFWLTVFFVVFLILPVLHTLVRQVRSKIQDTLLVLANAAVVFWFLWMMLTNGHRDWLALCSLAMGAAHLGLMGLVTLRCPADGDLRNALLMAGLAFLSLAVPLYFKAHTIAILWAVEAVALAAVGIRRRNTLIQAAAGAAMALAIGKLATELPLHTASFRLFFNPAFGAWAFVAAAILAGHGLYRMNRRLDAQVRQALTEVLYAAGLFILMVAISMESWHYGDLFRKGAAMRFLSGQMPLIQAVFLLLFAAKPLRPAGPVSPALAVTIGVVGSLFLVMEYWQFCTPWKLLFLNTGFLRAMVMIAAVFTGARLLWGMGEPKWTTARISYPMALTLTGIVALWLVMTEEIWFHYRFRKTADQWQIPAQMYISVLWAVYATVLMVVGFWRRVRPLRYIALAIFLILVGKVFLVDTRTISTVYRIAGFLVTGLALVGVSYLYQYLKKQGFFEGVR